jgi:hypothetical protein
VGYLKRKSSLKSRPVTIPLEEQESPWLKPLSATMQLQMQIKDLTPVGSGL